jgi:hypothetical protein
MAYESVDELVVSLKSQPPLGGVILAESAECFDKPFGHSTPEERVRFIKCGMQVLERWRNETPQAAAARESFEERVNGAAISADPDAIRELIDEVLAGNQAA